MAQHAGLHAFKGLSEALAGAGFAWLLAQLRANVYFERLSSGDRLPPVRKLAKQLSISPTTALELYKRLEDAGFVESRERSGTFLRRVGVEPDRDRRNAALFTLVERTVARARLINASPGEFAHAFLRYTGATSRTDFRFGLFTSEEVFELFTTEVHQRTGVRLPIVRLDPGCETATRALLARDPSIRCLVASFLFAEQAIRFADELGRSMVMLRLGGAASDLYQLPASGTRCILTRDYDFALAIRRLVHLLHGPQGAAQFCAASIEEQDLLAKMETRSGEIFVSPLCWDRAVERFGKRRKLVAISPMLSQQTLDDMLYHYVFSDERSAG